MISRVFGNMDLYKGIILASLVLLPAAGWWSWSLQNSIEEGEIAIAQAERSGGILQKIGSLQREVEEVKENKRLQGDSIADDPRTFFQKQIFTSSTTALNSTDFVINPQQDRKVPLLNALDSEVIIEFKRNGREAFALSREYINALLYNFENASQIWKLRELSIRNEEAQTLARSAIAPPPELSDNWLVDKLVYARRSPDNPGR